MKLRNKKTGEVVEVNALGLVFNRHNQPFDLGKYASIKELTEDWEDYKPAEPLIKDPKIRKAVRAWAEANDIEQVWHECASCWLRGNGLSIEMENEVDDLEQGNYTITELCGEEKE